MVVWGAEPEGTVTSFKKVGSGTAPDNLAVLIAANNAVTGVDLNCGDCKTHAPTTTKGGRSI